MKKNILKSGKGFTLIETMVAITILFISITGPISLAGQALRTIAFSKNNLIAANLAQEGVELIRDYRANNILQTVSWTQGIGPCESANGCYLDPKEMDNSGTQLKVRACPSNCPPITFDPATGLYGYSGSETTSFTRTIKVSISGDEMKVTVTITWNERFGDQQFQIESYLDNWTLGI